MFRWIPLLLGILGLIAATTATADAFTPLKMSLPEGITEAIDADTFSLSELVNDALSKPSFNQCRADVLTGGFISLGNGVGSVLDNHTVSTPYLFISCPNDSEPAQNDSLMLRNLASTLNSPMVINDIDTLVSKDSFEDSILIITFAMCAVCIGTWMVYLVWILLPSKTSFSKTILVPFYILFSAIYDTAMLVKGVNDILEKQYRLNIQDSSEYETHIVNGVAHKVGSIISNALLCLNWTALIYYMFHDNKRIKFSWLPLKVANRNRLIIIVGLSLTAVDTGVFAGLHWHPSKAMMTCFRFFEYTIYTLFCGSTAFYIWRDFRFILAPQRRSSTNKIPIKTIVRLIWDDYHETVPLLIYNIALFVLLYFTTIYFTIDYTSSHKWEFQVISFLKLIVTVSVWGLINVLERRELIISKATVLGRKIQNDDEYFFDPKIPSRYRGLDIDESNGFSRTTSRVNEHVNSDTGIFHSWFDAPLKLPARVWKSSMERSKRIRNDSRFKRRKIVDTLIGSPPTLNNGRAHTFTTGGGYSSPSTGSNALQHSLSSDSRSTADTIRETPLTGESECATVETTLARNYIYGYGDGE